MKRTARDKTQDRPRPVERIELSEGNSRRKLILLCALLVISALAFGYALYHLLTPERGWTVIQVQESNTPHVGGDFVLQYDLTDAQYPAQTKRALTRCYSDAAKEAYWIFHPTVPQEELHNLAWLNAHPNETVTVDARLYGALQILQEHGSRQLYLGPVYAVQRALFLSQDDLEAQNYDPERSAEIADFNAAVAAFAADAKSIDLKLLGENQVRLEISETYLHFCQENDVTEFLDFYDLKNAFVTDFLADSLLKAGFTDGYLVSSDGFTRNLDLRGKDYAVSLFAKQEARAQNMGQLIYQGPMSLVILRDYPLTTLDRSRYYTRPDGSVITSLLDAQAQSVSALHELYACSESLSCAQTALYARDVFVSSELQQEALDALQQAGGEFLYFENGEAKTSSEKIQIQP